MLVFTTCVNCMRAYFFLLFLWTSFPFYVLQSWASHKSLIWESSFWATLLITGPYVLLWFSVEIFYWFLHLLCRCSIFHQKLNLATQTCFTSQSVLLPNLPISVGGNPAICSSRSTFCFSFCLKSTTRSYQLFTYRISWICSSFSSPTLILRGLVLVTSLHVF